MCPKCKLQNMKMKHVHKFKYLGNVLIADGMSDTEIWLRIGIAKVAFTKNKQVMKKQKIIHWEQSKEYWSVTWYQSSFMIVNAEQSP